MLKAAMGLHPLNNWRAVVLTLAVVVALHLAIIAFLAQRATPPPVSIAPPRAMTAMLVSTPVHTQPLPEPAAPVEHEPEVVRSEIQKTEITPKPLPAAETPEPAPLTEQNIPEQAVPVPAATPPQPKPPSTTQTLDAPPPVEQRIVEQVDAQGEPEPPVIAPVSNAAHLSNPAPVYPRRSQRRREQGTVMLDVLILADGSVAEVHVKESSGYQRLDQAALNAIAQWRYLPANRGGEAIDYWHVQPVVFALR